MKAHKKEDQNKNSGSSPFLIVAASVRNLFIYTFTDVYECAGGEHLSGGRKYGQQLKGIFRRCASLQQRWNGIFESAREEKWNQAYQIKAPTVCSRR